MCHYITNKYDIFPLEKTVCLKLKPRHKAKLILKSCRHKHANVVSYCSVLLIYIVVHLKLAPPKKFLCAK